MDQKSSDITVLESWDEVKHKAAKLQKAGWDIHTSFIPFHGQKGYLCTQTQYESGEIHTSHKSYVWNIFGKKLTPVILPCNKDVEFLSFIWVHSSHQMRFFEVANGDCGMVCYCKASQNQSLVLFLGQKELETLSENAQEVLQKYISQNKNSPQKE